MRLATAILASLVCTCGCATHPTDSTGRQLTIEDAGPAPVDPEAAFREVLRYRLKDPDSALVRIIGKPVAMVTRAVIIIPTNGGAGWQICAEVNAKNSYGAYVGYKRIFVLWNAGKAVDYLDGDFGEMACRDAS